MYQIPIIPAVSCGAPFFVSRVTVDPFNSTLVGSEVSYQCQPGLLPEGRRTSVCGGDGRWNSDPTSLLCGGKTYVVASSNCEIMEVMIYSRCHTMFGHFALTSSIQTLNV